ncbi:tyrosine-type recombinase/integrase [Euzebya rosea]|uniref:tyrosine-type recombinase/integrase n=1 Tax=Euzebya rosea TaxID=2052804 RepID=UPI0013001F13|nr:site-specific integrase [Euzebya rosea]
MNDGTPARPHGAITLMPLTDNVAEMITAGFLAGYKRTTREAYTIDLRLWSRFLATHDVDPLEVQRAHIELWMRHEEDRHLKPATVARRISTVRLWYRYAFEEGHLPSDPAARVRRPKVHDEPMRYDRRRRELARHATHVVAQQVAASMRT